MNANRRILLISPQPWGKMFVAKHHYAVELARLGNEVFFLNPPSYSGLPSVKQHQSKEQSGLWIVDHSIPFPSLIRFKARAVFDLLMKWYLKWLGNKLGKFDLVWCFELNLYADLKWFGAKQSIYHPVDEVFYDYQLRPGRNADLVISVTHEILSKFKVPAGKKIFINHGISKEFARAAGNYQWKQKFPAIVGYSGNLLRADIDFDTIRKCITDLPEVRFRFWGNYDFNKGNLSGSTGAEVREFIEFLKKSSNVELIGTISPDLLPEAYSEADLFIICYDIERDQSRGTNYHKVMEFLSTGKSVVTNNITTYSNAGLLQMCSSRKNNDEFPGLLKRTLEDLSNLNAAENSGKRIAVALDNTYEKQIERISKVLDNQ